MQLGAGTEGSLARRLAWLTALRLVVLTVFLVVTAARFKAFSLGSFSGVFALITIGVAYLVAAGYAMMLRRGRALTAVACAQLVTDQVAWTALIYISGGVHSGATSLYGLTSLSGAILLGVGGGVLAAIAGAGSFLVLCAGFAWNLLPAPPDQPIDAYLAQGSEMGYPIFVNLVALGVVTALASYLAERLRTTGGRLEIATARAEKAERLAALGHLAAGLAHEIRNPLGAIAGSIELLRTGGTLSDADQKLCEIVERETSRVNDLVGDMLDLAKPRAPAKAIVDLSATVRDVVVLAARSGRGADVTVRYDGPHAATVDADAAQMRQVAWNLVRNAIQASSAGDEVLVHIVELERECVLEVLDHGLGIPAEARDRVFDAFFTTRSQGVGIGLAVVKQIVDDHGFTIEVDNREEGRGTVIRVRMPKEPAARGSAEPVLERA